jgi:hypothetical protein
MDNPKKPKVPSKKEFDAMTPAQKTARTKEAMMQNLNLSDNEKKSKVKKDKEMESVKEMNRGGEVNPSGGPKKRVTGGTSPVRKAKAPMKRVREDLSPNKRFKSGGKVRGCGMARGGSVRSCKMVKMKGA